MSVISTFNPPRPVAWGYQNTGLGNIYWAGHYGSYTTKEEYDADIAEYQENLQEATGAQPLNLVNEQFDAAGGIATAYMQTVSEYIDKISDISGSLEIPETDDPISGVSLPAISPVDYSGLPSFSPFSGTLTALQFSSPALGVLQAVPTIDGTDIQIDNVDFTENQIIIPTFNTITAPGEVLLNSVSIPDQADVTMPVVPVFTDLVIPDSPTLTDTLFNLVAPVMPDNLTEPANLSWAEGAYSSDLKVALFQRVLNDIMNGGTGLNVDVEQAIYDRATERQQVENERLYTETVNNFSGTGWELPTGVFASAIAEIQKEISRKNDQNSRELTILQAELEQKNVQFTVAQMAQLETTLMEFYSQQSNRSLDAAKTTAAMGVEILNSLISKYNAKLKKYETEAVALGEWIKFEANKVENYKAQLSGVKIAADIQDSKAGLYEKQLKAVEIIKSMYQLDLEGARLKSSIEKDKLEQLKIASDVYLGKLSGEKSKVDIYQVMNEAEKTRAGVAVEKMRANSLRLEAAKEKAAIQAMQSDSILKQNQQQIDKYKADIDKFRADISDELKNADLNVKGYDVASTAFNAKLRASEVQYATRIKELDNSIHEAKLKLEKAVETTRATIAGYETIQNLKLKGFEGVMSVAAQISASAMNQISVSASVSDSTSRSATQAWTQEALTQET